MVRKIGACLGALGLLDVLDPAVVRVDGVDRDGDRLHIALLELGLQLRHHAKLRRADLENGYFSEQGRLPSKIHR